MFYSIFLMHVRCTTQTFLCTRISIHGLFDYAVILAGNAQNMKPVQNCTGFLFCALHAVVHLLKTSLE